jgi:hypothetical protein
MKNLTFAYNVRGDMLLGIQWVKTSCNKMILAWFLLVHLVFSQVILLIH